MMKITAIAHQLSSHLISATSFIPFFISISFFPFNYPHLISLAAAAYARTRKPEDQGDIFFPLFSKAHTFKQTSAR